MNSFPNVVYGQEILSNFSSISYCILSSASELTIASFQWVDDIGGVDSLGDKLLSQRKGDELPIFVPPEVSSQTTLFLVCKLHLILIL